MTVLNGNDRFKAARKLADKQRPGWSRALVSLKRLIYRAEALAEGPHDAADTTKGQWPSPVPRGKD